MLQFKNTFNIQSDDFDSDGLPEEAALALLEAVVCANDASSLWGATLNALDLNLAAMDGEPNSEAIAEFREAVAALMTISVDTQVAVRVAVADIIALTGAYQSVTCLSPESCTPAQSAGLALAEGYEVYSEFEKGPDEPYSGEGDLDFDNESNLVEWNNVVAIGGSIETFATAATDPSLDGAEQPGEGEGEGEGEGGTEGEGEGGGGPGCASSGRGEGRFSLGGDGVVLLLATALLIIGRRKLRAGGIPIPSLSPPGHFP